MEYRTYRPSTLQSSSRGLQISNFGKTLVPAYIYIVELPRDPRDFSTIQTDS